MIVLDTNIVSEVMSKIPSEFVLDWLNEQRTESLYLTSITIAEIGYGLKILPNGKRRKLLEEKFEQFIAKAFEQRILDFDEKAARLYSRLMKNRRKLGRPLSILDGQIAAIARSNSFIVATRNIRDFEDCGLKLINPFLYQKKE